MTDSLNIRPDHAVPGNVPSRRRFLKRVAIGAVGAIVSHTSGAERLFAGSGEKTGLESAVTPPEVFLQPHHEHSTLTYSNPARLPDGKLVRFGVDRRKNRLLSETSTDGGRTWGNERFETDVLPGTYCVLPLVDSDGEFHLASMVGRGDGRRIAVDRFIDIWHYCTTGKRTKWKEPNVIFKGYCGALLDFKQLSTGRLICPFAWWVPNVPCAPPVGPNLCTVYYSDDGGGTWTKSKSDLSSPCYPNFVGNNYGADEPCVLELRGRPALDAHADANRLSLRVVLLGPRRNLVRRPALAVRLLQFPAHALADAGRADHRLVEQLREPAGA